MFRVLFISILLPFLMVSPALADEGDKGFFSHAWQSVQSYFSYDEQQDKDSQSKGDDISSDSRYETGNTTPPTLTLPNPVNIEATGVLSTITLGTVTATDSLGNSVTVTNNAPATFPIGTTIVTYTATDIYGNVATTTQTVTVTDTTPPTINIQQPAITIEATTPQMSVNLGTVTATDIVDGAITPTNNAPVTFPLGVTSVTWTATDAAGNAATAVQQVTVQDTTPPVLTPPAAASGVSQDGYAVVVNIGTATATDAFNPVTITNDAPTKFPVGNTTVTWTATDTNNNIATATQLVTVTDNSIFANLPPDPGAAGKATLAGIDSDNDGVRDDVQRWIAINYPHSEKTRAALRQLAIARQNFILSASDANAAYDNAIQMGRGSDCLFHLRPVHWYDDSVALEAVILNTAARSREYLKANHLLSGRSFGLLFDPVQGCDFNPTLMAN